MLKLKSLLLLLLTTCMILLSNQTFASDKEPDFRQVYWGMTREQVKALEILPIDQERPEGISYTGLSIDNKECLLFYLFADNKLYFASYHFFITHATLNDYLYDHYDLRELLIQKYGQPIIDRPFWKNEIYKNDPDKYGLAVSLGHLEYESIWETGKTKIKLLMEGVDQEIRISICYYSKEFYEKTREIKKQQDLKNL